ncbi:RNA-binding protein 44 [Eudromia elegans]
MELEKNSGVKSKTELFLQTSHLLSYSEKVEHTVIGDLAAEVNCSGFGQACSVNVSELKLSEESSPYLASSLDGDLEMYNEERARVCCACGYKREKEAGMPGRACNDTSFVCRAGDDYRPSDLSEDSQLEYVSGDEQDYCDKNSSSKFCKQMKTVGIKTLQLLDTVHEVPGNGIRKEQDLVNILEGCSTCKYCIEAAVPELPQEFQDCLSLPVCKDMSCDCEEDQTEYHSVLYENTLESHTCESRERTYPNVSLHISLENDKVKDNSLLDGTQSTKMTINEKTVEKNDRHVHSIAMKQEGFPAIATRFCRSAGEPNSHRCDEYIVCALGTDCVSRAQQTAETQCPVPEIHARENPLVGLKVVDKSGGNVRYLNPELEWRANLDSVNSDSKVTINQTVDASSDFRACFTTSRATSAQVCLVSRALNTDITMMNKSRPMEWRREICADVACNTDWSWVSDGTQESWPQFADVLGKQLDGNPAAAQTSQIQAKKIDKLRKPWWRVLRWPEELEHVIAAERRRDLELFGGMQGMLGRPLHLEKQSVKDSIYCRKLLWRAIQAELQVLNMHYQMCCHHCYKINKLMLEEEKGFYRCIKNGFADTELNASLLSVLEELKKNYETMKKKVEMGVPLNALPSLSVETRLFTCFSSYVPGKACRVDPFHDSTLGGRKTDFEESKLPEMKTSVSADNPHTVHLTGGSQPRHSTTSKTLEDYHKDEDGEHECRKNEEMSEYWFDAKENLPATDISATFAEKQQEKQDTDSPREKKIMESASEVFFILVGGLSSSVSEGDLRSYFQKYQVNNILIYVDSADYRYAFLCFKDANKAKLAVEEMNRTEIKGKTISVELVKNASGNRASIFQKLLTKFWYEIQSINSENSVQDKTFPLASNSVKASAATSASEKVLVLPTTSSKITCCTPASSKSKHLDLKSSAEGSEQSLIGVNQKDTEENSLQKTSPFYFSDALDTFIPPNTLNLSSFTKLMKKLQEIHPETSREKIIDALLQVRTNNKGILSGLSINSIVKRTSLILRKSMSKSGGKKPGGGPRALRMGCGRPAAALRMALLPRRFLCFVLAQHFIVATACHEADYGQLIRDYCLSQFQASMEALGPRLWCDWEETLGTYGELTNCTALLAEKLACYWPNRLVDDFFVAVHRHYFRNCSQSGRALRDPPPAVLCPFIAGPVLVMLLATALVVWRSKRSQGMV